MMNYIKAKYLKNGKPTGRSYTFCTDFDVYVGDVLITTENKRVVVVAEEVDMEWVETYGRDKIAYVKRFVQKGKRYYVLDDEEGFFQQGEIVVALEDSNVPYCVRDVDYREGKTLKQYMADRKLHTLMDYELKEI